MFVEQPHSWNISLFQPPGTAAGQAGMRVRDDIPAAEWDHLVAGFDDATEDASHAFRRAVWGEQRISRVAVMRDGHLIGLALAIVALVPGLDRGVAHVRSGPLWRRKGEPADLAVLAAVLAAVTQYYVVRKRLCLKILPPADPRYCTAHVEALSRLGFARTELPDDHRYLVNAAIGADQQLASLSQKWRYNLRKALQTTLDIRIEVGPEGIEVFDALFREMEQRKVYQGDTWAHIRDGLRTGFPGTITPSIVTAQLAGKPIAGAVIGHLGETAHYIYGATADAATAINAGYALHWWIINWLHGLGYRWYDLGGESGDQGLRQFKKGFAGQDGAIVPLAGEFTLCSDPLSRMANGAVVIARAAKLKLRRSPLKRKLMAVLTKR